MLRREGRTVRRSQPCEEAGGGPPGQGERNGEEWCQETVCWGRHSKEVRGAALRRGAA